MRWVSNLQPFHPKSITIRPAKYKMFMQLLVEEDDSPIVKQKLANVVVLKSPLFWHFKMQQIGSICIIISFYLAPFKLAYRD